MRDVNSIISAQMSRLSAQDTIIEQLRQENRVLKGMSGRKAPFPTCGVCSGELQLTRRVFNLTLPTRQIVMEYWDCPVCK